MLSENLKNLRISRGMSQELMAQQLNVVRQTVSKWEKGLSVPDALMLEQIAELFEVPVAELLGDGADFKKLDDVAAQLALLNAQMAAKTQRSQNIWKNIKMWCLIVLGFLVLVWLMASISSFRAPVIYPEGFLDVESVVTLTCTLDGKVGEVRFECNGDDIIIGYGGDGWLFSLLQEITDSKIYGYTMPDITDQLWAYIEEQGGTMKYREEDPDLSGSRPQNKSRPAMEKWRAVLHMVR